VSRITDTTRLYGKDHHGVRFWRSEGAGLGKPSSYVLRAVKVMNIGLEGKGLLHLLEDYTAAIFTPQKSSLWGSAYAEICPF